MWSFHYNYHEWLFGYYKNCNPVSNAVISVSLHLGPFELCYTLR